MADYPESGCSTASSAAIVVEPQRPDSSDLSPVVADEVLQRISVLREALAAT
jgi:hypothetical protein